MIEAVESGASLPDIPAKRYFTIGEVAELCGVKPYVLRYWEQEFNQLKPVKRRGNRRYYQHHEVLLIRRIRDLLYDQGFTISGARNQLQSGAQAGVDAQHESPSDAAAKASALEALTEQLASEERHQQHGLSLDRPADLRFFRNELIFIQNLLRSD